jgi:hypothetical protein
MTIICNETREEKQEVMLWLSGQGPVTPAVQRKILVNGITFGVALITRNQYGALEVARNN